MPIRAASERTVAIFVRPIQRGDLNQWRELWDGYNAFYGRHDDTALAESITAQTWRRFFDASSPVNAVVAERQGRLLGLAHYLFHPSTSASADLCYLQDLFTHESARGTGVGRALIEAVCDVAREAGSTRVYWQTQVTNAVARVLYDGVGENSGFIVYRKDL